MTFSHLKQMTKSPVFTNTSLYQLNFHPSSLLYFNKSVMVYIYIYIYIYMQVIGFKGFRGCLFGNLVYFSLFSEILNLYDIQTEPLVLLSIARKTYPRLSK